MGRPQKKRRQASTGAAAGGPNGSNVQGAPAPDPPRPWAELPREIVAMIALATCDAVEPLPFICIPNTTQDISLAYHRHDDRSFGVSRGQFGAAPAIVSAAPAGAAGPSGRGRNAAAAAASAAAPAPPVAAAAAASAAGVEEVPEPTGPPGTFQPARMSAAAAAMRCVCRAWCALLGEGVRRLLVPPPQASVTLWPSHFPHVTHLALGGCDDVIVVLQPESAGSGDDRSRRRSSRVAALAPATGAGGSGASGSKGPDGSAAAEGGNGGRGASAAGKAGAGPQSAGAAGAGAAAAVPALLSVRTGRTLAPLSCLRNLQVSDSTPHLDLAASAGARLEELVVTARQPVLSTHSSSTGGGAAGGGSAAASKSGGKAAAALESTEQRSALKRTLSALPGLRRLRLSGMDASSARLGSALMGLSSLSSLRLMHCLLPTFFGTGGGEAEEEEDWGGAAAGGGRGRGGRGGGRAGRGRGGGAAAGGGGSRRGAGKGASPFAAGLLHNLGTKLQDLSLQGCQLGTLPAEVLAGLPLLRLLDLSANHLAVLPPSLTSMKQLEYLDLQGNRLVALPAGFGSGLHQRLADLDLSQNDLRSLPADFSRLTGLSYLGLANMTDLDWESVARHLAPLTRLIALSLDGLELESEPETDFDDDDEDDPLAAGGGNGVRRPRAPSHLAQVVSAVCSAAATDTYTAHGGSAGGGAGGSAGGSAGGGCRLRELVLDGCGTAVLPACFSQLTALSYLSLNCNFINEADAGVNAAVALAPLASLSGSLAVLRLSYLDLHGDLPPVLWGLTALRELALEQNFIEALSPQVSCLTNLQVLNLADVFNPDTQHRRTAMPWRAVYHLTKLRELKVTGFDNAAPVSDGIGSLYQLEVLMLNSFRLPPAVLEELASGCGRLCCLELRLGGIKTLPPSLTRLERLTELDLIHNSIATLPPGFGSSLSRLTDLALADNPPLTALTPDITALTRLTRFTWSVQNRATRKPSAEVLTWLAGVPNRQLIGAWDHSAAAAPYGVKTTCELPFRAIRMVPSTR